MDKKFYTIEYKSQKQRIKIFENIVKEFCNNSKIPVEYNKNGNYPFKTCRLDKKSRWL